MSCIPSILEMKGEKEFIHVYDPEQEDACDGLVIEGGGEYRGYHYLITFTGTAHRCGYVAIPPENPINNFYYEKYNYPEFNVHGGITFFEENHLSKFFLGNKACNDKWIGFDAAHGRDGKDWETHAKYFGKEKTDKLSPYFTSFNINSVIRSNEYMVQECKDLIDQLIQRYEKL